VGLVHSFLFRRTLKIGSKQKSYQQSAKTVSIPLFSGFQLVFPFLFSAVRSAWICTVFERAGNAKKPRPKTAEKEAKKPPKIKKLEQPREPTQKNRKITAKTCIELVEISRKPNR